MRDKEAERWLSILANLGRAANTILAYRRALNAYFEFCDLQGKPAQAATSEHIALFVRSMTDCRSPAGRGVTQARSGLANATMRQRLTAVRLYYDHLVEEGIRSGNPVGHGRYTQAGGFGGTRVRALLPRYTSLPWIPNNEEWRAVLQAAKAGTQRNRLMLALAYDAGLRREELCSLSTGDLDPANRLLQAVDLIC